MTANSHYNEFLAMDKADQERALAFMRKWERILAHLQSAADPQEAK